MPELGIPWLEFAPKSKPTQLIQKRAEEAGIGPADVLDEEHLRSLDMWAALEQGESIFDFDYCSAYWCGNHDALKALFAKRVDVSVRAPEALIERLLSDLYDWNHGLSG